MENSGGTGRALGRIAAGRRAMACLAGMAILCAGILGCGRDADDISAPPPLVVTTASLPNGTAGQAYSATLQATGGKTPLAWSVTSGTLPAGLALNASTGVISGTPSAAGTANLTFQVADSSTPPQTATKSLTLTIQSSPVTITTTSLPNGTAGQAYSATLQATGGTPPISWSITTGALPAGLSLNASTGVISGTPSVSGTFNFTVQAADSSAPQQTATRALSLTVAASGANDFELNGTFTFVFHGFDANGAVVEAGSFNADGSGHITGGVEDLNRQSGPQTAVAITGGSYSFGPAAGDTAGAFSLTTSLGTTTYAIVTVQGSQGRFVEFDSSGTRGSGVYQAESVQQTSCSVSAFNGLGAPFDMGLSGADASNGRVALAGSFPSNGSGTFSGGVLDADDAGTLTSDASFSGTITAPADQTNGRCAATLTLGGGASLGPLDFSVYPAAGGQWFAVSVDPPSAATPLLAGLIQTSVVSSSNSVLNGAVVFESEDLGGSGKPEVELGLLNADGSGHITSGTLVDNDGGTVTTSSLSGTYSVAATGRTTFTLSGVANPPVFYLVGGPNVADTGFLVGTDPGASSGTFFGQLTGSTPPTDTCPPNNGDTVSALSAVTASVPDLSGVFVLNGSGAVTGEFLNESDSGGADFTQGVTGAYSFTNAVNGTTVNGAGTLTITPASGLGSDFIFLSDSCSGSGEERFLIPSDPSVISPGILAMNESLNRPIAETNALKKPKP